MCQLPRPTPEGEISILSNGADIFPLLVEFFHSDGLTAALRCRKKKESNTGGGPAIPAGFHGPCSPMSPAQVFLQRNVSFFPQHSGPCIPFPSQGKGWPLPDE